MNKREKKRAEKEQRVLAYRKFERANIPTPEDWYPSIQDQYVDGAIIQRLDPFKQKDDKPYWLRICFWGGDDFGMEQDFFFETAEETERAFAHWQAWMVSLALVEKSALRILGFQTA